MACLLGCVTFVVVVGFAAHRFPAQTSHIEMTGRVALTVALVCLAPAMTDATALLFCTPTVLGANEVAVLDGGANIAAGLGPTEKAVVPILSSNPFFV